MQDNKKPFQGAAFVELAVVNSFLISALRGHLGLGLGFGLLLLALALLRLVLDVLIVDVHSLVDLGTQSSVIINAARILAIEIHDTVTL